MDAGDVLVDVLGEVTDRVLLVVAERVCLDADGLDVSLRAVVSNFIEQWIL